MPQKRNRLEMPLAILTLCVALAGGLYYYFQHYRHPNSSSRIQIQKVVLSSGLTPQEKMQQLAPYVQVGDNVSEVDKRISPCPGSLVVSGTTHLIYQLEDHYAYLELMILGSGEVVGVGWRDSRGSNVTAWLAGPE